MDQVYSAGGLVVRRVNGQASGLFVGSGQFGEWQIPKGMAAEHEEPAETAVREVEEETGMLATALQFTSQAEWDYIYLGKSYHELCRFYLMIPAANELGDHDDEYAQVRWIDIAGDLAFLKYDDERLVTSTARSQLSTLPDELLLANGVAVGIDPIYAAMLINPGQIEAAIAAGGRYIFACDDLNPRDVRYVACSEGVIAVKGGVASHLAVVALSLGRTAISSFPMRLGTNGVWIGDTYVPEGASLRLDPRNGAVMLPLAVPSAEATVPETRADGDMERAVTRGTRSEAQMLAWEWAGAIAERLGLAAPENWKIFKREVLARYFPTPYAIRHGPGWSPERVRDSIQSLQSDDVRVSVFPGNIACHSVGIVVPRTLAGDEILQLLDELDRDASLEVFVPQAPHHLAWRIVFNDRQVLVESGIGQAVNLFENERGQHNVITGRMLSRGSGSWILSGTPDTIKIVTQRFLGRHGAGIVDRMEQLCRFANINTLAIEGYYDVATEAWVTCDADYPYDSAFML